MADSDSSTSSGSTKTGSAQLGGGIGGAVGGLLSGPAPTASNAAQLDAGTQGLINTQRANAGESNDQITKELTTGVQGGNNQFSGPEANPTQGAVSNMYKQQLGNQMAQFTNLAQYAASQTQAQRLQVAQANANAADTISGNAAAKQVQLQLQANQAYSNVISSVLGIGGKIIGTAAAVNGGKPSAPSPSGGGSNMMTSDQWASSMGAPQENGAY